MHVSASLERILEAAEEMEICKKDSSGLVREFVLPQLNDFLLEGIHHTYLLTLFLVEIKSCLKRLKHSSPLDFKGTFPLQCISNDDNNILELSG